MTEQLPITTRLTPHIILKAVHVITTFDISTFCYGKIDYKRYPACGGDREKITRASIINCRFFLLLRLNRILRKVM